MNHLSNTKLFFFFLFLGVLLSPMHPPIQADTTKAACEAQKGTCKEVCDESDNASQGLCTDLTNSGTYCCIPKANAGNTQLVIDTKICEDNGGRCVNACIFGQTVGSCKTGGGSCCAGSDEIAQKIQASNITATIKDPVIQQQALASIGAKPIASENPAVGSYNYTLLEKIPGIDSKNLNFAAYLSAIYKLAIWIVGLCALFMFLVGAFMYMLSAANTSKIGSAKSIMQDALIGLVLALSSYLILYVINPDLVNLKLPTVSMSSGGAAREPGATAPKPKTAGDVYSNSEAVQELSSHGISVSSSGNCSDPTNSKCTSLENIPKSTIADIIKLKDGTKCPVTITGGTEVGHKSHGAGLPVVDLSENSCLEQYFSKKPIGYDVAKICSDGNSQAASYNCGNFVESQAHFHVQFST